MPKSRFAPAGLAAAALALGCNLGAPVARVQLTSRAVVSGCYAQARIVDASVTTTASGGGVTAASLSDPSVAQLLQEADLPSNFPVARTADRVYLKALSTGNAKLTVNAKFNDGSNRSATANLHVRAADTLSVEPECDANVDLPLRVPAGATVVFDAVAWGGGEKLAGYCPGAFSGDQVTCAPYVMDIETDTMRCQWTAPMGGGAVTISSNLGPTFSARLETYSPADVAAVVPLTSMGTRNIAVSGGGGGTFPSYVRLAGGRPCKSSGVGVKSLTPTVCAGPQGETVWATNDAAGTVAYTTLAEGKCQLGLGGAGAATYPSVAEFSTRVATDFTVAHTADPNMPCSKSGATACFSNLKGVVKCQSGGWSQPSLCADDEACEVLPSGSNGCTDAGGCARCR